MYEIGFVVILIVIFIAVCHIVRRRNMMKVKYNIEELR